MKLGVDETVEFDSSSVLAGSVPAPAPAPPQPRVNEQPLVVSSLWQEAPSALLIADGPEMGVEEECRDVGLALSRVRLHNLWPKGKTKGVVRGLLTKGAAGPFKHMVIRIREDARAIGHKPSLVIRELPWGIREARGAKKSMLLVQNARVN